MHLKIGTGLRLRLNAVHFLPVFERILWLQMLPRPVWDVEFSHVSKGRLRVWTLQTRVGCWLGLLPMMFWLKQKINPKGAWKSDLMKCWNGYISPRTSVFSSAGNSCVRCFGLKVGGLGHGESSFDPRGRLAMSKFKLCKSSTFCVWIKGGMSTMWCTKTWSTCNFEGCKCLVVYQRLFFFLKKIEKHNSGGKEHGPGKWIIKLCINSTYTVVDIFFSIMIECLCHTIPLPEG